MPARFAVSAGQNPAAMLAASGSEHNAMLLPLCIRENLARWSFWHRNCSSVIFIFSCHGCNSYHGGKSFPLPRNWPKSRICTAVSVNFCASCCCCGVGTGSARTANVPSRNTAAAAVRIKFFIAISYQGEGSVQVKSSLHFALGKCRLLLGLFSRSAMESCPQFLCRNMAFPQRPQTISLYAACSVLLRRGIECERKQQLPQIMMLR